MNDFTKEELQLAHEYLRGNTRTWKLADKIQSMIDNYCEHDYRTSNESHFKCKDCGVRER